MSKAHSEGPDFSTEPSILDQTIRSGRRQRLFLLLGLVGIFILLALAFFTWFQFNRSALVYAVLEVRLEADEETNREILREKRSSKVKSLRVISHALNQPQVAKLETVKRQANPVQWLEAQLQVDLGSNLNIVNLSIRGRDSAELVVVLDAVVEAYVKEIGVDDPETLAKKAREEKEWAEQMDAKMPPGMRQQFKQLTRSQAPLAETPRVRVVQKATVWK